MADVLNRCIRELDTHTSGWGDPKVRWVMDFPSYKQLLADLGRRDDPSPWIPSLDDQLFGIWVEVRDDAGPPHIEAV